MGFSETVRAIFNPSNWTDKAFVNNVRKSNFTNEPFAFRQPTYGITPVDTIIGSVDYRGANNPLTGINSSRNFLELFDCVPEIFAPIHAIASRIANADFQLRKNKNDQVVYDNEDWNRLFNTPNPMQHFRELIYEAVVYELVTGNEYMYFNTPSTLAKDYKNVAAIWNLPAELIDPVTDSSLKLFTATTMDDVVKKYKLDKDNFFETKDVLHIKSVNLNWKARKIKGRSPLLSAEKAVANLIAVYEARNVIYTKRGAMGFIVSRKSDDSGLVPLLKGEKERMQQDFQSTYGLTGGRGLLGITDQPVDYVNVGASIRDLEPFRETLADAKAIYSVLGVPEDMMPNEQGATFENQIQAERRLYSGVVIPKANMYMQSLTNKLGLNEAKFYLHASFDHVEALQENKKERADVEKTIGETYLQRFLNGVCPLNEWIVSTGNDKVAGPLFEKRLMEMTSEELAQVKSVLQLKGVSMNNANTQNNNDGSANTNNTEAEGGQSGNSNN